MAGIYLHIPFCRQACHYCDFHFSTSLKQKDRMIDAMVLEMEKKSQDWQDTEFTTLYIGGGTPSLLEKQDLHRLMEAVRYHFRNKFVELTLEVNPDDVSGAQQPEQWLNVGINRLSIGVQSFHQRDLQWMNRIHNPEQAQNSILWAQKAGFRQISLDLIYGTPGLSDNDWKENLNMLDEFEIPHFSAYALTVEPKTPLDRLIQKGRKEAPSESHFSRQFDILMDFAEASGYVQYEISNFCRPGMESEHNRSYWQGRPYLGIGPSAHEFSKNTRSWNVRNNTRYMEALELGLIFFEREDLGPTERFNETVMTALRTLEGLDTAELEKISGLIPDREWFSQMTHFIENDWVLKKENRYCLTRKGKHLADYIASELFMLPDEA